MRISDHDQSVLRDSIQQAGINQQRSVRVGTTVLTALLDAYRETQAYRDKLAHEAYHLKRARAQ